ncbi:antifungal protein ginkbilobin-like protein [Lolium rigidum]|uniref:antifungal protein ginkbilobin-like protein n=1 Tax=Lolium rigidum TaxID=89674 RepID=UPI001F5D482D|nr:antifungal protein ginkbilobin-like protein [Lolium rigidum]
MHRCCSQSHSASTNNQLLIAVALLLLLSTPLAASGAPNSTPLSVRCNGAVYGVRDPFAESLAYVLADLLAATPSSRARDAYSISPYPNAFAYGHAKCGGAVTSCLGSAVGRMNTTCHRAVGARAVLVDCRVRYEQYAFVD